MKGDLDQILVFVSPCVAYRHATGRFTLKLVWFVFRHSCGADHSDGLWFKLFSAIPSKADYLCAEDEQSRPICAFR